MTPAEVREQIDSKRNPSDCFIKWWGDDEALIDYELLDRFLAKADKVGDVSGFKLLGLEEMWQVFIDLNPDRLTRDRKGADEVIRWIWKDRLGQEQATIFPFTPEGLMELMENEFFD